MPRKKLAKVFVLRTFALIRREQALDGVRNVGCGAAVANGSRNGGELPEAAAYAEVVGIDHLAVDSDFLAFNADVGDPVLAATVGAAGDVEFQLLIETG